MRTKHYSPKEVTAMMDAEKLAPAYVWHVNHCEQCRKQHRLLIWFRAFQGLPSRTEQPDPRKN